mmetsp:Transcript_78015/g.252228  ORF Transcript_78015/g.252228 Transcript_78015/m.252228 type:complete len:203 (-) Transcript_78015:211-819(-)
MPRGHVFECGDRALFLHAVPVGHTCSEWSVQLHQLHGWPLLRRRRRKLLLLPRRFVLHGSVRGLHGLLGWHTFAERGRELHELHRGQVLRQRRGELRGLRLGLLLLGRLELVSSVPGGHLVIDHLGLPLHRLWFRQVFGGDRPNCRGHLHEVRAWRVWKWNRTVRVRSVCEWHLRGHPGPELVHHPHRSRILPASETGELDH